MKKRRLNTEKILPNKKKKKKVTFASNIPDTRDKLKRETIKCFPSSFF